jgi:transcriptional regulator with XRE-family HTH domain
MNILDSAAVTERLRTYREKRGLTLSQFAMQAGIDAYTYAMLESDEMPLTDDHVVKILFAFPGINRNDLLFGEGAGSNKRIPVTQELKTDLEIIKESVSVAKAIIRLQPKLRDGLPDAQLVTIYQERENKFEMSTAILAKGVDDLLDMLAKSLAKSAELEKELARLKQKK